MPWMPEDSEAPRSTGMRSGSRWASAASMRSREVICHHRPQLSISRQPQALPLRSPARNLRPAAGSSSRGQVIGRTMPKFHRVHSERVKFMPKLTSLPVAILLICLLTGCAAGLLPWLFQALSVGALVARSADLLLRPRQH